MGNKALVDDLRTAKALTKYWRSKFGAMLTEVGVRDSSDADGDRLGDSPEASMVRVHARAALGALEHLASSLENLAELIDPDTSEN